MAKASSKSQYRICNWSEYDAALKQRGSLTFWISEEVIEQWLNQEKTGRKGASNPYSDLAIELMATLQSWFGLAGRQTEGAVESIFALMGIEMPVPARRVIWDTLDHIKSLMLLYSQKHGSAAQRAIALVLQ